MFRNYLTIALRNLSRHKLLSFINVTGLAVGLACATFILLFARDELSYDRWVPGTHDLYRIEKTLHLRGRGDLEIASVPFPLTAAMQSEIPEVKASTRISYAFMTVSMDGRMFRDRVASVDPNFFQLVRMPLVKGDSETAFSDPESVVISESAARKYFGTTDVIGRLVRTTANCEGADAECLGRLVPLKVTGVMRDIPHNSHLTGDVFIPNTSITDRLTPQIKQSWRGNPNFGYVLLAPGVKPETVLAKLKPLLDRIYPADAGDDRKGSQRSTFHLTPFVDVHLTSDRWLGNVKPSGSWVTLYGVGAVGILVLFVAWFNFTNVATAVASLRAREIALRKMLGATRRQLIVQFLGEAVLTALLSLVLAMALVEILGAPFERLLQRPIAMDYEIGWLLPLILITVFSGLVSGIYPALLLSGFRPSAVLGGFSRAYPGSSRLQKLLVILQFTVSIGLGIVVMVILGQIDFARNIDMGFRKENLLVVSGNGLVSLEGSESFVQRLRLHPGIVDVAVTDAIPFATYTLGLVSARLPGRSEAVTLNRLIIGANAAQVFGMRLLAGRMLSDQRSQDRFDTQAGAAPGTNDAINVLVDDIAAASLGFAPQQAVGKTVTLEGGRVRIAGVVANVKFDGAREPGRATMYVYDPNYPASVLVRLRPDSVPQALAYIDRMWREFAPTKAINRYFVNDGFQTLYQADERQGRVFGVFVGIALFISCLGLYGLAAFTAGRRTREIGIRKVFGARTRDIVRLLLWQFSIPVLIANLIAWPLAWYYLQDWLQGFAYRIALSPLYFLGAGLAALLIAWATVFVHALHVARTHPVQALRYE